MVMICGRKIFWGVALAVFCVTQMQAGENITNDMKKLVNYKNVITRNTVNVEGYTFPIIRLSDLYLMYAEALNETGSSAADVLGLLDAIRTRAGLTPLDPVVLNSQALVAQAIQDERRLELAFEGHRWFDLVRTDNMLLISSGFEILVCKAVLTGGL